MAMADASVPVQSTLRRQLAFVRGSFSRPVTYAMGALRIYIHKYSIVTSTLVYRVVQGLFNLLFISFPLCSKSV